MTIDQDSLIAYALDMLSAEEARAVEAHLKTHPEDAAFVREQRDIMAVMMLRDEPAELPAEAELGLLQRIRSEAPQSTQFTDEAASEDTKSPIRFNWQRSIGFALAAALIIVAWLGFVQPALQTQSINSRLRAYQAEPGAISQMLTNEDNQSIGTLVRFTDNHIFLVLDKAAPPSQVYQAWEIVEGQPASLGIWSGRVFETTQALSANSIFGVTLEPPGGSTQPSSTPIILYNL